MGKKIGKGTKPAKQIRSDLTGYAALLGDSFASRVDLLEKVIQGAHYPSLGHYKERLLVKLIRDYIPRTCDVGTGFVLFPHEDVSPPGGTSEHDPLNRSAFTVSRQCDILVFDSSIVPPVFRDDDFVVIRPEAVRAVIEVKGSLDITETDSLLESFVDFGRKWRTTQLFYKSHYQNTTPTPTLLGMAWRLKPRRSGKAATTPSRVRERVANYYRCHVGADELKAFPVLDYLFIYNECEIGRCSCFEGECRSKMAEGWSSRDGKFVRFDSEGRPYRDKDRTIASLLASLHYATGPDSFNRFFSYADESRSNLAFPYPYYGFSEWLEGESDIRDSHSRLV